MAPCKIVPPCACLPLLSDMEKVKEVYSKCQKANVQIYLHNIQLGGWTHHWACAAARSRHKKSPGPSAWGMRTEDKADWLCTMMIVMICPTPAARNTQKKVSQEIPQLIQKQVPITGPESLVHIGAGGKHGKTHWRCSDPKPPVVHALPSSHPPSLQKSHSMIDRPCQRAANPCCCLTNRIAVLSGPAAKSPPLPDAAMPVLNRKLLCSCPTPQLETLSDAHSSELWAASLRCGLTRR